MEKNFRNTCKKLLIWTLVIGALLLVGYALCELVVLGIIGNAPLAIKFLFFDIATLIGGFFGWVLCSLVFLDKEIKRVKLEDLDKGNGGGDD